MRAPTPQPTLRQLRRGTALVALLAAASLAGCSCDPDPGPVDGGPADAGADAGLPDAGPDAGPADGGADGGVDAGPVDGGAAVLRIDRVLPVRGESGGGTRVTINGRGFIEGFAELGDDDIDTRTAILFGSNTALDFDVIDDDTIEVVSPAGVPGLRDVTVQNPNGEAVCEGCFTYYDPLEAHGVSPNAAPVTGGVQATLTGSGFTADTLVLVGDREAISLTLVDSGTLTFVVPPAAAPGVVDVAVLDANGRATLRRRFTYWAQPRLQRVEPPVGPAAGGTQVTLHGQGLSGATAVSFGGVPLAGLSETAAGLTGTAPAGPAGTTADVIVEHPRGTVTLQRGFTWVDPEARDLSLLAVSPARASSAGGDTVTLVGTGLTADTQIRIGDADVTQVSFVDGSRLLAVVPPGPEGPADVQVRNARGGARLTGGLRYFRPVEVQAVTPAEGPAEGGTAVTVTGAGFRPGIDLRLGALPATGVTVLDEGTLTATTPAGSPGPADVVVGHGAGQDRVEGVLQGGFAYGAPLQLAHLDPPRGAQAGGTYVLLTGRGFTEATRVLFGGAEATVVSRTGNVLAVRTPQGDPGLVDVQVQDAGGSDALPLSFQYYDPVNRRGGASGGPLAGTLNVTVLDAYFNLGLPGVHVMLGADPDTPFQGLTDERGQITFSDPGLVKAQTVTASAENFESITVSRVDARDLTLFLTGNAGGGSAFFPPSPPPAFVGGTGEDGAIGRVCGFKLPPGRTLAENEAEVARVYVASRSIFSLPPYGWEPYWQTVDEDCGYFNLVSRAGAIALYAVYGIETTEVDEITGDPIKTFEPLLMGITRGLEVPSIVPPTCSPNKVCPGGYSCSKDGWNPDNPNDFGYCLCDTDRVCDEGEFCNGMGGCQPPLQADIVLSMHMDLDVPIRIVNPPQAPAGTVHLAFSYLELGNEGVLYFGQVQSESDTFTFPHHPRLPGDGFVFLDQATNGGAYPLSFYYRRQIGDLAQGVDIGPMQPMTRLVTPASGGTLTGTRIQWAYDGTPEPDVVVVDIGEPSGFGRRPIWSIILPGSETSVEIPPAVMEQLSQVDQLGMTITTALSPRFDFDHFSYGQLGYSAWNSFTLDEHTFRVP